MMVGEYGPNICNLIGSVKTTVMSGFWSYFVSFCVSYLPQRTEEQLMKSIALENILTFASVYLSVLLTFPIQKVVSRLQYQMKLNFEAVNGSKVPIMNHAFVDFETNSTINYSQLTSFSYHCSMLSRHGFWAFYDGWKYKVVIDSLFELLFGLVNNPMQEKFKNNYAAKIFHLYFLFGKFLIGFFSGVVSSFIMNPLQVLQARYMQMDEDRRTDPQLAALGSGQLYGKILDDVFQDPTILWKGFGTNFVLAAVPALFFLVKSSLAASIQQRSWRKLQKTRRFYVNNSILKRRAVDEQTTKAWKSFIVKEHESCLTGFRIFLISMISKAVSTFVSYPVVTVRTRCQYKKESQYLLIPVNECPAGEDCNTIEESPCDRFLTDSYVDPTLCLYALNKCPKSQAPTDSFSRNPTNIITKLMEASSYLKASLTVETLGSVFSFKNYAEFRSIVDNEGWTSLYGGFWPKLLQSMITAGIGDALKFKIKLIIVKLVVYFWAHNFADELFDVNDSFGENNDEAVAYIGHDSFAGGNELLTRRTSNRKPRWKNTVRLRNSAASRNLVKLEVAAKHSNSLKPQNPFISELGRTRSPNSSTPPSECACLASEDHMN